MRLRIVTLAVVQFFDFGTFVTMTSRYGPAAEANPLVASLFIDYGLPILLVAKVAVVVLAASVVVVLAQSRRRRPAGVLRGVVLATGLAAGMVGGMSNAATLI
jgi:hypothetical protein